MARKLGAVQRKLVADAEARGRELQLALATESSARETAIEDTTSELRAAHASLREELLHGDALKTLRAENEELRAAMASRTSEIAWLQSNLETAKGDLASCQARLADQDQIVARLVGQVERLSHAVRGNEAAATRQFDVLADKFAAVSTLVESQGNTFVEAQRTALAALGSDLRTRSDGAAAGLRAVQKRVATMRSDVDNALTALVSELKAALVALRALEARATKTETDSSARFDAVAQAVSALAAAIQ